MDIKTIFYKEFVRTKREWSIEKFELGKINLLVGKNAAGKTRTLNIIGNLANMVSGYRPLFSEGDYKATFSNDMEYILRYKKNKITKEKLVHKGSTLLERGTGGKGKILAKEIGDMIDFQAPQDKLTVVDRRDTIQHPFFEEIYKWGKFSLHFYFGKDLGQNTLAIFSKKTKKEDLNLKETGKVVGILKSGIADYTDVFSDIIKEDMGKVGFEITDIGVSRLPTITVQNELFRQPEGIYVKETDLPGKTDQTSMSQGMFRTLSLIIQFNYSQLTGGSYLILVDDIGEGLDYERSTNLIKLIVEKAEKASIQLVMATNDRHVMNHVPLEYWSVLQRDKNRVKIYNYINSQELFEEFKYTGLTNFDFFSTDFHLTGFDEK